MALCCYCGRGKTADNLCYKSVVCTELCMWDRECDVYACEVVEVCGCTELCMLGSECGVYVCGMVEVFACVQWPINYEAACSYLNTKFNAEILQ